MSKIIIGIHGLGNKPPKKILEKWWKQAIQEGLKAAGYPNQSFKFELVYWAPVLHPIPLNPNETNKKSPFYLEFPYIPAHKWQETKPSKLKMKVLHILEQQFDKLFLNEDMSLNLSSITDLIVHRYFTDLEIYYAKTCFDETNKECYVNQVIRKKLTRILLKHRRKDILLLAHSMGSIIAYDVISQPHPHLKINTFITIGSPLGLPIIQSKIYSEQQKILNTTTKKSPKKVVNHWYNFSDLNDRIAINYDLSDDFNENAQHVRPIDYVVHNNYEYDGKKNPHKSYGYLRAPEVAKVIHEFLNQDRNKVVVWVSENLGKLVNKFQQE